MARVSRPDQEKVEEDPTLVQPQDPAVAQSLGAAGPASAPGGKSSEAPAAPAARSHFNDLSRLLYANQGQGAPMAQGAIGKADQAAADVNSRLANAQNRFSTAAQAGTSTPVVPAAPPPLVNQGTGATSGPLGRGRTTTRLNTGPSLAQQEQVAGATYKGPATLAETPGVNLEDLQLGLNRAGQEYAALNRNPSQQTGGIGRFNDFLIGSDGGREIKAAQNRFQGLRDRFNISLGDTSAADAGRATTKKNAQDAQTAIDRNNAEADSEAARRQAAESEATAAAQAEDDYFSEYRHMNPTLSEAEARRYYDADTEHIKQIIDNNRAATAGTGRAAPTRGG